LTQYVISSVKLQVFNVVEINNAHQQTVSLQIWSSSAAIVLVGLTNNPSRGFVLPGGAFVCRGFVRPGLRPHGFLSVVYICGKSRIFIVYFY